MKPLFRDSSTPQEILTEEFGHIVDEAYRSEEDTKEYKAVRHVVDGGYVTYGIAKNLAKLTGTSAEFWTSLQDDADSEEEDE